MYLYDCVYVGIQMDTQSYIHKHIFCILVQSFSYVDKTRFIVMGQNCLTSEFIKNFYVDFFFLCMGACNLFFVMNSFESFEYRFLKKKILQHNGYTCSFNHLKKDCLKFNIFILNCHKNA